MPPSRRPWTAALGLMALIGAALAIRRPSLVGSGFVSHDVGGILYNGMLLRSGGLPFVDSIEYKAPGTFYLAAALAGPEGRDIAAFQAAANLWAVGSLVVLVALAWRLWGAAAGFAAGLVYLLHDADLDSMDANYVTWAQLPTVAAGLAAVVAAGWREGQVARARTLAMWALAGACCGLAALCKQPAGVVLLPVLAWALLARGRRDGAAAGAVLAGAALSQAPLALHYLARGHLGALLAGYIANPWGYEYMTSRVDDASPATMAWRWAEASGRLLALPLLLAGATLLLRRRGSPEVVPGVTRFLGLWAAAELAAAAVGLRFYRGYYLAALPPLCLLAAAPGGLLSRETWRGGQAGPRRWVRWLLLAPALALTLRAGAALREDRALRARPADGNTRALGRFVGAHTRPGERIWVWGWHLWGVYAYSGRLSASRLYKTLGYLTPVDFGTGLFLADSPWVPVLLDELAADPPAYVVIGGNTPRDKFVGLRRFLGERYVRDRRIRLGKVEVWRRADREP